MEKKKQRSDKLVLKNKDYKALFIKFLDKDYKVLFVLVLIQPSHLSYFYWGLKSSVAENHHCLDHFALK